MSRSKDDMDLPSPSKLLDQKYPREKYPALSPYKPYIEPAQNNNNIVSSSKQLPYIVSEHEYHHYHAPAPAPVAVHASNPPPPRYAYNTAFNPPPLYQQQPPPPMYYDEQPPPPMYYNDNRYYYNDSSSQQTRSPPKVDRRTSKFRMIPTNHDHPPPPQGHFIDDELPPPPIMAMPMPMDDMPPPGPPGTGDFLLWMSDEDYHDHDHPDMMYEPMMPMDAMMANNKKNKKKKPRNRARKYQSKRNKNKKSDNNNQNNNNTENDGKKKKKKPKNNNNVRWKVRTKKENNNNNNNNAIEKKKTAKSTTTKDTLSTSNSGRKYPNMKWYPKNRAAKCDENDKNDNNGNKSKANVKKSKYESKTEENNNGNVNYDDDCCVGDNSYDSDDNEIVTKYKSSPSRGSRFFTQIMDLQHVPLSQSTLILPTIGVGNVAQIAVDILLTSLDVVKIGYITDRNVRSAVGNDAFVGKKKKKKKRNARRGCLNTAIEVYWCDEYKLCIIQQRSALRFGGRGEYVSNLMQWIHKYDFQDILLLTSEYRTKRSDFETKNEIVFSYYYTPCFEDKKQIPSALGWSMTKKRLKSAKNKVDNEFDVIGGGICRKLYLESLKCAKSMIVICQYSEDGDNSQESMIYLKNVVNLVESMNDVKLSCLNWEYPRSLSYANGGELPNGIY